MASSPLFSSCFSQRNLKNKKKKCLSGEEVVEVEVLTVVVAEEDLVVAEVEDLVEEAEVVDLDEVVAEVVLTDNKTMDLQTMLLVRS